MPLILYDIFIVPLEIYLSRFEVLSLKQTSKNQSCKENQMKASPFNSANFVDPIMTNKVCPDQIVLKNQEVDQIIYDQTATYRHK